MDWEVKLNGSVGARSLPIRSLEIPVTLVWKGQGDAEIQAVEWWGSFYPGLDLPPAVVPVGPEWLTRPASDEATVLLRSSIDARFVQLLEERRNGGGPVTLDLCINVRYRLLYMHELPSHSARATDESPPFIRSFSHPLKKQVQTKIVIQRDQWLGILRALQWDEFQVFEVAVSAMSRLEGFVKALGHLDAAQIAFRQGQWSVTVTEVRRACEAAAREVHSDAAAEPTAAFEKLMEHVLPAEQDKPKRKALNHFMLGLAQLRHPAAHGHSDTQIERAEAELALSVAVSLFRYIGEVTAKRG